MGLTTGKPGAIRRTGTDEGGKREGKTGRGEKDAPDDVAGESPFHQKTALGQNVAAMYNATGGCRDKWLRVPTARCMHCCQKP